MGVCGASRFTVAAIWRESFFKSRNCFTVLRRMLRPGADMRIAKLFENAPKAHLRQIDRKALPKHALQIHAAPAHNPVNLRIRTRLDHLAQFLLLF